MPVSDEIVEELKAESLLPVERFLDLLIDRVGYFSYLKDQVRTELKSSGWSAPRFWDQIDGEFPAYLPPGWGRRMP